MKRTSLRRRRAVIAFCRENRRLFPFVGAFLAGVTAGVSVFLAGASRLIGEWESLLRLEPVSGGFSGFFAALGDVFLPLLAVLVLLFLLGLWGCGAPFILLVPLAQGLAFGMTQAYYYSLGREGVLTAALVLLPAWLPTAAVLTVACAESLRLSLDVSRQLLPGAPCGGLWNGFRLYCLRFLVLLPAGAVAVAVDVALRLLLPWLTH